MKNAIASGADVQFLLDALINLDEFCQDHSKHHVIYVCVGLKVVDEDAGEYEPILTTDDNFVEEHSNNDGELEENGLQTLVGLASQHEDSDVS